MAKNATERVNKGMSSKMNTKSNFSFIAELEKYFDEGVGSYADKIAAFAKFVPRQRLTDFLSIYEIFKKAFAVQGSIIDCGVFLGRSLMMYAQLSAILEPMNYQRQIIGFDTFDGYPRLSREDAKGTHDQNKIRGFRVAGAYEDLARAIGLYDKNRPLGHIPKVLLVKGDVEKTAPQYVRDHPHLVVSLLSLDLSLYAPTKAALKAFVPRMPKGAVITFGEMNCPDFVGEVKAVMEELGVRRLRIQRNPFDTVASFAVLE